MSNSNKLQTDAGSYPIANSAPLIDYERLRRLELDVKRLRDENAALALQLRHAMTPGRIAQRARDDAMLLVGDYLAGLLVSRLAMETRHGLGRRRWEWARALLRYARCTDQWYRLQILDPRELERRLDAAVERIVNAGDAGLAALKERLPRGRRRELS